MHIFALQVYLVLVNLSLLFFFILAIDIFKDFEVDFCVDGFFSCCQIFHFKKRFETDVLFSDIYVESSLHIKAMIDGFFLSD